MPADPGAFLPRGCCGYADLLISYGASGREQMEVLAALLDYGPSPPEPLPLPAIDLPSPLPTGGPEEPARLAAPRPLQDVPFWRLEGCKFHQPKEAEPPRPARRTTWENLPDEPPASGAPLCPWNALVPRLRVAFAERAEGKTLDIAAVVRCLGSGRALRRLPRLPRRRWGTALQIILDRSNRLIPFLDDQNEVAVHVAKLFPRHAVDWALVFDGFDEPISLGPNDTLHPYSAPPAGTPVLTLSDLGCFGPPGRHMQQWEAFGRRLITAGCRPVALTPCPAYRWPAGRLRSWTMLDWERRPEGTRLTSGELEERAQRLLRLLSPAIRVEPGLLRDIRVLLGGDADAGTEADAWSHSSVAGRSAVAATLDSRVANRLREEFAAQEPAELRTRVVERMRQWRGGVAKEVWAEELLSLDRETQENLPEALRSGDLPAARQLLKELAAQMDSRIGATAWYRRVYERVPLGYHAQDDPELAAAQYQMYEAAFREAASSPTPPPRFDPGLLRPVRIAPWRVRLEQRGSAVFAARIAGGDGETAAAGGLLGHVETRNGLITLSEAGAEDRFWRSGAPPSWAREWGTDGYGPWVTFAIDTADGGSVVQRLRWIAPGTFRMGSPKDEPGRDDDEGPQHAVTISRGFWMADTACTQALWQAVMGENPSRFKGDKCPVEQVSWDDAQAFLDRLDERLPGLGLRLPSEGEWEYACRAGTTTPFSFGSNITAEQVNYNGKYPYGGGKTGPFRGETVPVASLPANPWGLYEMHGNVREWCADGQRRYGSKEVTDPLGPTKTGAVRVLRGGSWFSFARNVRSASRNALDPGDRIYIGFRCARVQEGAEPRGAENGCAAAGRQAERRTATDRPGAVAALLRLDGERRQAASPLPPAPAIIVRSDCESLTLRQIIHPKWASAIGRDRFGLWAEFEIAPEAAKPSPGKRSRRAPKRAPAAASRKPVAQRLRWIPPGRFLMGSPEEEAGRWDCEGPQHLVTIGDGFWLADTTCTQALWQAVMGDNPSEFKSAARPVEQVSWDDVQRFLASINERLPGLDLVLPTEAQWEYACRAGTDAATYAGDLTILGGRNAPALDPIAWYGGNSGKGFDLPNGYDSSDWPEKQYSHNTAGTRAVKLKAPNEWGLHDMLGNVSEWCADPWQAGYDGAPADGSIWQDASTSGAKRVLRGGSWRNSAHYVRSASRGAVGPGVRIDDTGFRCARVQP